MVNLELDKNIELEVKKISFKGSHAWVSLMNNEGTYVGTIHFISDSFCQKLSEVMPNKIILTK